MAQDTDRKAAQSATRPDVSGPAPTAAPTAAPEAAAHPHSAETALDRAAQILAANGASPALLDEIQAMQANVLTGQVSEDIVILLLEAAITHHLPDIASDEREWAKELVRIAGI